MKRASAFVSLVAMAAFPACVLEVQEDPEGGYGTGRHGGRGSGTTTTTHTGGSQRDAGTASIDSRRPSRDTAPPRPDVAPPPSRDTAPPAPEPTPPDAGTAAPSEAICRHNAQCQGGRCVAGACQRPCSGEDGCGTGHLCSEGFCQPSPKPGDACVYSSDCYGSATCVNGFCHQRCAADGDCSNDRDRCDRGLCRPDVRPIPQCTASSQCPSDRTCVDAVCRNPCRDDTQCGPGCSGTVCSGGYCFMPEELVPPTCPPAPPTCGTPSGCPGSCAP
jgi:hypothetical protein